MNENEIHTLNNTQKNKLAFEFDIMTDHYELIDNHYKYYVISA